MNKVSHGSAATVILYKDKKILLQRRLDNKCWAIHGGHIEIGEVVEEAAKRELFEETGLEAQSLELFGVFSGPELHHVYPDGNEIYVINICYLCNDFTGTLKAQESEVLELKWFDIDNIPANISSIDKAALEKFTSMMKTQIT